MKTIFLLIIFCFTMSLPARGDYVSIYDKSYKVPSARKTVSIERTWGNPKLIVFETKRAELSFWINQEIINYIVRKQVEKLEGKTE